MTLVMNMSRLLCPLDPDIVSAEVTNLKGVANGSRNAVGAFVRCIARIRSTVLRPAPTQRALLATPRPDWKTSLPLFTHPTLQVSVPES